MIFALDGPSMEYEQLRRKIEFQTRELGYFTLDQMTKLTEKLPDDLQNKWKNVISRFSDQNRFVQTNKKPKYRLFIFSRVLLASIRNITAVDGYQYWREAEHESLANLMQARLQSLQNPSKPCDQVKRVTCNINKGCGYGCEIHHTMHCFHIAYALGRPMILFSDGWRYNPGGFDQVFKPPSDTCNKTHTGLASSWSKKTTEVNEYEFCFVFKGKFETDDVVDIPLIDNIHPRQDFMPMAVPEDIADRLIRLHGNPFVWFTGQLMKYLLRPQPWLDEFLKKKYEIIEFQTPIVG